MGTTSSLQVRSKFAKFILVCTQVAFCLGKNKTKQKTMFAKLLEGKAYLIRNYAVNLKYGRIAVGFG